MADLLKLIIFLHVYYVYVLVADNLHVNYLLCKNCGHEIASIEDIVYVKSPLAIQTWNDTLFHDWHYGDSANSHAMPDQTSSHDESRMYSTIQLLKNPHGNTFEIITMRRTNFLLLNNTKSLQDTWFPNFKWTIGVCPNCLNHLGWYFESILGEEGFFAVILDQIISQNYADTLIIQPKLKML